MTTWTSFLRPIARHRVSALLASALALAVLGALGHGVLAEEPPAPADVPADVPAAVTAGVAGAQPDHHRRYPRYPYPILIGGCATPIAPPPPAGLPVPPGTTPQPTRPPLPTPTPGGQAMTVEYKVCPQVEEEIPDHIKQQALDQPWTIYGFDKLRNPNTPYHPLWNGYRRWLSLRNYAQPYSTCNPARWKAGCP